MDSKGFWRHQYQPGKFIWDPPPGAAAVAIEELRKARIKRQDSTHVFICPWLLKPEWYRQLYKAADLVFDVCLGADCWPKEIHEPLIIGLVFPFLSKPPWQLRTTPKMFSLEQRVRQLWKELQLDPGDLLCQFLLDYEKLRSMPADVVWQVLFIESRCLVSCQATGNRRSRKRKQSNASATTTSCVGKKAKGPR
jgi:hypothetical protein